MLDSDFPFALSTLYTGKAQGRYDFLTHIGPDGAKSKRLWIDIEKFNRFAYLTGRKYRLRVKEEAHA